ncbi:MAG: ABC transporter ATP-binding protein [Bacillota bacterium]
MELQLLGSVPGRLNERGRAAGAVAIRTVGLTRIFGSRKAVDSVNLEVRAGEVFGFLGPNGAGKTTTINMILGLIRPTAGHVEILGQRADWACPALRRHVGSLLDGMRFYPYLSGRDNLRVFAAALDGIPSRRIDEVLDLVGLAGQARDKLRGYSHGMRRRLGLALALLHDPAVLVLDEPANGLDPAGIKEMRDLMKALAAQGKAVFLSSHLLHEVEIMCDRVAILRRGVMLAQGRVDELLGAAPAVEIAVDRPEEAERILLAQVGVPGVLGVPGVRRDGDRLVVEYVAAAVDAGEAATAAGLDARRVAHEGLEGAAYRAVAGRLNAALASQGIFAHEIRPRRAVLEDVFFEVLNGVHDGNNATHEGATRREDARR